MCCGIDIVLGYAPFEKPLPLMVPFWSRSTLVKAVGPSCKSIHDSTDTGAGPDDVSELGSGGSPSGRVGGQACRT